MKFHPILFSSPMVQAILEGTKTQTRRLVKDQQTLAIIEAGILNGIENLCPYGKIGDVLWVRETFVNGLVMDEDGYFKLDEQGNCTPKVFYKADGNLDKWYDGESDFPTDRIPWKPSIHMPKSACRIFLRITNIRVERLQDISEQDSIFEGVEPMQEGGYKAYDKIETGPHKGTSHPWNVVPYKNAVKSFESLWQSINGQKSWDSNPFVWVIEFKSIQKPMEFTFSQN